MHSTKSLADMTRSLIEEEVKVMTKAELIEKVAENAELTKKDAAKAVDAVFDVIMGALAVDEKVQVVGFGSFEVRSRAERKGRNPQTGEEISVAARKVPVFKAGKLLKDSVN